MELTPNQIEEERRRVERQSFQQYLLRMSLVRVRGFHDEHIEFKYPVTALIGTNGGGKSTILGAAALAYKDSKPISFFPKAPVSDDDMADWRIDYVIVNKTLDQQRPVPRRARFAQQKWRRDDLIERNVVYIEIQRTVPAGEIVRLKRFLKFKPNQVQIEEISDNTKRYAGAIIARDIMGYRRAFIQQHPEQSIYIATHQQSQYSQFHFGAGEASIISTVDRIESAPDNSLILIEEVENGLHPLAVRSFIHYLMNVSRRKRHQIIFTTHSQDAIDQLPTDAIWACINSRMFNGKLSIESLRVITGNIQERLVIFVEDIFAEDWVRDALRQYMSNNFEAIAIYKAGGYPNAVKVTEFHNQNPTMEIPAICLIDGDIYDPDANEDLPEFCHLLEGTTPETTVFDYIYDNRVRLSALIKQRCLLGNLTQDRILQEIVNVRNSQCDPHQLFESLGRRLGFVSEITIRQGLINIFNEEREDFWNGTITFVRERFELAP